MSKLDQLCVNSLRLLAADAIEKANLLFTTGYFSRTLSHYLFVKEQIQKGTLGKITRVRGSNCHSGSLGHWFDTEWRWMADPKIAGVGAFGDLGTHLLDILMWLVGDVESVTADIKVVLGNYGDCDESGEALIRFKNGITGTLAAGWVDVADPVSLIVSGTEGHIAIMNGGVYFKQDKIAGANGSTLWKELPKTQPLPLDLFLNAVGGQSNQPLVTPREAAARVAVMEAMYRASKEKAWVTVG
jgi:predicted dehydrogenase